MEETLEGRGGDAGAVHQHRGPLARLRAFRVELILALLSVGSSLLVYAPFRNEMSAVYRVWDGPNYLTIAKTLYDVRGDNPLLSYVYEKDYFFVHLPAYPLVIRLFSFIGFQRSLLFVSLLSSAAAAVLFYRLARDVWKLPSPAWLTVVFLFLPPRWLLYRSVGSTEAMFMALTLGAIALFERGKVGPASLLAGLATLTRISGLMMLPAFGLVLLVRKRYRALPWIGLVPLPLLGYFAYCTTQTGNFLQYFKYHADKISPPQPFGFVHHFFKLGLYHQVEFYILLALAYAIGISRLYRKLEVLFAYCLFEYVFHIFISTEDWSRYWLAMAPFALIVGYNDLLSTKPFRLIFPIFAVMGYVYSWGTIPINACRPDIYAHLLWNIGLWQERGPDIRPPGPATGR